MDDLFFALMAQTIQEGFQALREFGVTVCVMGIMLAAFLWNFYKMREDSRYDRDRLTRMIEDQRTIFIAVMKETQADGRDEAKMRREDLRQALLEQSKTFQEVLTRLEAHWQRAHMEICRRLELLSDEVQQFRSENQSPIDKKV